MMTQADTRADDAAPDAGAAAPPVFRFRRTEDRVPLWGAVVTVGLVGLLIWLSLTPLNPDWLAYLSIFGDEGAWLSEQGRDPLFLFLVDLARNALGPDSYEDFRAITGLYLGAFTALLAFGRVLRPRAGEVSSWALIAVILGFALTRFTIQIREGIAATLILWALASMISSSTRAKGSRLAWILLLAAALIHVGTAVYLAVAMLVALLPGLRSPERASQGTWSALWCLAVVVAISVPLAFSGSDDANFLARSIGERVDDISVLTTEKVLLQLAYGAVVWTVGRQTRLLADGLQPQSSARAFVRLLGGPLLVCLYGLTVTSVLVSEPNAIISSYSRFVYLCLGLCLVLAAFGGGRRMPLILSSLLLIGDQVRIVAESAYEMLDAAGF